MSRREWDQPHNPPETAVTKSESGGQRAWFVTLSGDEFVVRLTANDADLLAGRLRDCARRMRDVARRCETFGQDHSTASSLDDEVCRAHHDPFCIRCDTDNDDLWMHTRDLAMEADL